MRRHQAGPDDALPHTAGCAGEGEESLAFLTSLSAKIGQCKLERRVKQLRSARLVGDAPATEGDVDIQDAVDLEGLLRMESEALGHDQATVPSEVMEEREEEEVPLRRKRSGVIRRSQDRVLYSAFAQFHAPHSTDVLPQSGYLESMVSRDAQADVPLVSEQRAKELDELLLRMTDTDWLTLMMQVGTNPALAPSLMVTFTMKAVKARSKQQLIERHTTELSVDFSSAGSAYSMSGWLVPDTAGGSTLILLVFYCSMFPLRSNGFCLLQHMTLGISPLQILTKVLSPSPVQYVSGVVLWVVDKLPDEEIVESRVRTSSVLRCESDDDIEEIYSPNPYGECKDWEIWVCCPLRSHSFTVDGMEQGTFGSPSVIGDCLDLWRDVNMLCQSLHSDDVDEFWKTQDDWVVSGWKLYPKSSVHVLDLTNGKTVYMFVDKFYPIRAPLLERMLRHRLTVPPSYCRDVVVAGNVIQTVQVAYENYECLALLLCQGLTSLSKTATVWKLLLRDVAASFDSAVHRDHAGSFDDSGPS
ncbi:hypothetical protein Tco_0792164 [Tanacetum coccineum]